MRSRRTGSRSIRALPPTLPPAISTCARSYRPCPRPGLRCWAPAPPGRCSRSSRRAPRSCGCSRRRRRPSCTRHLRDGARWVADARRRPRGAWRMADARRRPRGAWRTRCARGGRADGAAVCLSRCRRGRLGRRRRPSRDARRRLGAGARVTRRSRAAARGGGAGRGSRTREARYLRRCCQSNCPLKDLRAALQRVCAGRRGSSSSAWVRSVAALWPWSTAPRFCGVDGRRPRSFCALRFF